MARVGGGRRQIVRRDAVDAQALDLGAAVDIAAEPASAEDGQRLVRSRRVVERVAGGQGPYSACRSRALTS
jgi:hypothetical protein